MRKNNDGRLKMHDYTDGSSLDVHESREKLQNVELHFLAKMFCSHVQPALETAEATGCFTKKSKSITGRRKIHNRTEDSTCARRIV